MCYDYEGEERRGTLESGGVYSVSAWSSGLDPSMHADCYFWCTGGGQPPSIKGETDKGLIEALVSTYKLVYFSIQTPWYYFQKVEDDYIK